MSVQGVEADRGGRLRGAGAPPPSGLDHLVAEVLADPRTRAVLDLPARSGTTGSWPEWVDPAVVQAYARRGVAQPWRHQQLAAETAWSGRHVIVATGTASGKSAAFGIPGLTAALSPPPPTGRRGDSVLYLSPTKALAHDQLAGLGALGLSGLRAGAYDGDTPQEEREWVRAHARWLVTNPDMLHRSLLPAHERWRSFLRALRFVVVDEAHVYRGVFGSQVALVLRRLRRVCALYGGTPTFILASATSADPGGSARRLVGAPVAVVQEDASARGAVTLALWGPAASPEQGAQAAYPAAAGLGAEARGSAPAELAQPAEPDPPDQPDQPDEPESPGTLAGAAGLMSRLVAARVSTLTFARSRRAVEVVAELVRRSGDAPERVRAYRGGYLPEERRALERDLREGRLLGLAATSALELGIDISGLDAVVLAGWPGTHSSFWQQVGRAGRRGGSALAVLIAREDPLDQYVIGHPEVLTGRGVEAAVLDPDNPYVLAGHLCCAAAEAPLRDEEVATWFGPGAPAMCHTLVEAGLLRRRRDGWYWTDAGRATDLVDLRGIGPGPVRVVEERTGRLVGTVDAAQAPAMVHPGALYVHQGLTYEVLDLDLDALAATVAGVLTDLSTHARTDYDVAVVEVADRVAWGAATLHRGEVCVTSQVVAYRVRRWPGGEVLAEHPLDLPPQTLSTAAVWWSVPPTVLDAAGIEATEVPGAVHALEHAAIGLLPLYASCDRWDLGGVSTAHHAQVGSAAIFVHDAHPGGAGFTERGFGQAIAWLTATAETIEQCPCQDGCPSCVQSPKCGNGNEPLDKAAALRLARVLLAQASR